MWGADAGRSRRGVIHALALDTLPLTIAAGTLHGVALRAGRMVALEMVAERGLEVAGFIKVAP